MRSRERRVAVIVGVALALGAGGTLSLAGLDGGEVVHAAVTQAKSLAELLGERSPGQRTQAELTKIKKAQRALPKLRRKLVPRLAHNEVAPPELLTKELIGPPVALPPETVAPVPVTLLEPPPTLGSIVIPPSGSPTPPGGGTDVPPTGGGGPVIVPPAEPQQPVTPTSPVPEPGTWAMMLLGFGFIGWRVRVTRAAAPQTA